MPLLTVLLFPSLFFVLFFCCCLCTPQSLLCKAHGGDAGALRATYQPTYQPNTCCLLFNKPSTVATKTRKSEQKKKIIKNKSSNKTEHVCGYEIVGDNLRTFLRSMGMHKSSITLPRNGIKGKINICLINIKNRKK